jgi:hypothetical protein
MATNEGDNVVRIPMELWNRLTLCSDRVTAFALDVDCSSQTVRDLSRAMRQTVLDIADINGITTGEGIGTVSHPRRSSRQA